MQIRGKINKMRNLREIANPVQIVPGLAQKPEDYWGLGPGHSWHLHLVMGPHVHVLAKCCVRVISSRTQHLAGPIRSSGPNLNLNSSRAQQLCCQHMRARILKYES